MDVSIAPEFPQSLEWLNLAEPLRMAQLRGKVCALAFINAGSAWSQQRLNDLAHLRARHGDRLNVVAVHVPRFDNERDRSEEHTSELQSLMRISYAVFCLTKKTTHKPNNHTVR